MTMDLSEPRAVNLIPSSQSIASIGEPTRKPRRQACLLRLTWPDNQRISKSLAKCREELIIT